MATAGIGGLGSYQLSDPSLAATPDWLKNRDPSLNRVDWGGNYDPVTGILGVLPFFVGGSEAQDASYYQGGDTSDISKFTGVLETGLPKYNISTEFGRPVDNYLQLNPESINPVRIINETQGKITYEGVGPQGLIGALDAATADGNKDIWSIQEKIGDQYVTTHKNEPIGNLVLEVAVPAMLALAGGAVLGPLITTALAGSAAAGSTAAILAGAAGTGLGTAAGSFTGNVIAGRSLEDSLIAAGISGLTAGVLKGVLPAGTPGLGAIAEVSLDDLAAAVAAGTVSSTAAAAAIEPIITVTAGNLTGAVLNTALTGLAQAAAVMATNTSSSNNTSQTSDINTN
jgi:hypothetical protein